VALGSRSRASLWAAQQPKDARTRSGGKVDVAAGADFDLRRQAFLRIFWGLGDASGSHHSARMRWLECLGGPRDPCSRQNSRKPKDFRGVLSSKRLCDRYSSRRGPIVRTKSRGPPRVSYRGDGCLFALLICKAGCTAAFAAFGAET
jgi:hypothetical protein